MKYSIMGFNQEKVIKYELDLTDLCILKWVDEALGRRGMSVIVDEEDLYVWMDYSTFLNDYPIISIGKDMLSKRISKLVKKELLKQEIIANKNNRGSRSYLAKTPLLEELIYSTVEERPPVINYERLETTSNTLPVKQRPPVINYSSNNTTNLLNNKKEFFINKKLEQSSTIDNTNPNNSNDFLGSAKPKKKESMYSKCLGLINEFTKDKELANMLTQFLNNCISNSNESGIPFYTNNFKGKLNELKALPEKDWNKIVKQTLDKGWNGFYPLSNNRNNFSGNNKKSFLENEGKIVDTDVKKWKEDAERRRREGKKVKF